MPPRASRPSDRLADERLAAVRGRNAVYVFAPPDKARFPWPDDQSYVACNLASGNIANNLASMVMREPAMAPESAT